MLDARIKIADLINQVKPFDLEEQEHIQDALDWIASGVEIFRIEKPATPLKHLVSYSVLVDFNERKVLLLDHKKALKKLPSGGHIDKDEMPYETAKRELIEELGIESESVFDNPEPPFFVTVTETVGLTPGHIDVSLWYIFEGDSKLKINDESEEFKKEFDGFHWLGFDEILSMPIEEFDPHLHRFVNKLKKSYGEKKERPSVGVATIVMKDGKILIGEDTRKGDAVYGVPGGHWESGETLKECAAREVKEESGIECKNIQLVSVYDFFREDKGKSYVTIGMKAEYAGGEFADLREEGRLNWNWYDPEESLKLNLFAPDKVLIERCLSGVIFE